MLCKILKNYSNANNWTKGNIVDITDPAMLIRQGLVELHDKDVKIELPVVEEAELVPDMSWKKPDLVTYAKALGVKSNGNKQNILNAINEGGDN